MDIAVEPRPPAGTAQAAAEQPQAEHGCKERNLVPQPTRCRQKGVNCARRVSHMIVYVLLPPWFGDPDFELLTKRSYSLRAFFEGAGCSTERLPLAVAADEVDTPPICLPIAGEASPASPAGSAPLSAWLAVI